MSETNQPWQTLADDLNESGPPHPLRRALQADLERHPLPAELDARVLAQIRAAARDTVSPGTPVAPRKLPLRPILAAAAALVLLPAFWFFAGPGRERESSTAINGQVVRVLGSVHINDQRLPEDTSARAVPAGSNLRLADQSLCYVRLAPAFVARLVGPARVEVRSDGMYVREGRVSILADAGQLVAASDGDRAAFQSAHAAFRLASPRASYRLLGTMLALDVPALTQNASTSQDVLRVLEGRVEIRVANTMKARSTQATPAQIVPAGGGLRTGPTTEAFVMTGAEIRALRLSRRSLETLPTPGSAADKTPSAGRLEELRTLYGSVTRFRLRDGRLLEGQLIQAAGDAYIHTPTGRVRIDATQIDSFELIEE